MTPPTSTPKFTRHHYEVVAKLLHDALRRDQTLSELTDSFATVFQMDNPNFQWDRFHERVLQA